MSSHRITRREAVKATAAAALTGVAASPLLAAASTPPAQTPVVGVATLGFGGLTNRQVAEELAANGIRVVQLFLNQTDSRYWKYNGRTDVSGLTAAKCKAVADAYKACGVAIHSLGVYTNLIHPDEAERKANLAYFEALMKARATWTTPSSSPWRPGGRRALRSSWSTSAPRTTSRPWPTFARRCARRAARADEATAAEAAVRPS